MSYDFCDSISEPTWTIRMLMLRLYILWYSTDRVLIDFTTVCQMCMSMILYAFTTIL